jgi:hypothetical protein
MWKEIADYDSRAAKGEVCVRGIAHNPKTCPKCIKDSRKKSSK